MECAYEYFFSQFVCCSYAKEPHCLMLFPIISIIVIIRIHLAFCPREHPRECKLPILVSICTAITEHTHVVYLARAASYPYDFSSYFIANDTWVPRSSDKLLTD